MEQISQPGHEGGFLGGGLIVHEVLGGDWTRKHKRYQDAYRELHGSFSSILGAGFGYRRFYTRWRGSMDEI